MAKEIEIIEKSCLTILKVLKRGKFTRPELEFLKRFSQEIVSVTEKKLSNSPEKEKI